MLQRKLNLVAPALFVLFTFFIPISPSIKSFLLVGALVSILLTPLYRQYLAYAFNSLWGRISVFLFIYILIACFWSSAPYPMQMNMIEKYGKLIYLPILAAGFIHPQTRLWCINSYLLAMILTCLLSFYKVNHLVPGEDIGQIFYNHIVTGYMMALAAYLAAIYAIKSAGSTRFIYSLLLLLFSYHVLFINTGRAGYIIYFVLMTLLLLQNLSLVQAAVGIIIFSGALILVYQKSPILQLRIHDSIREISSIHEVKQENSLAYRMQFHHYAHSLFAKSPLIGIGTGGFKYQAAKDKPVQWDGELKEPHSQYWLILVEQGLLGLLLLLTFLGGLWVSARKLVDTKPILIGTLISFAIFSLSDTVFCYSTAGYLLIIFSALCFGELIERYHQPVNS